MAQNSPPHIGSPSGKATTDTQESTRESGTRALDTLGVQPHPAPLRILVVDDERAVRVSCEGIARSSGFDVASVGSAKEALEALAREPFDIILLDIRMPKISGLDVLEELLAVSPGSYVVMMTGYASVESAVEAMRKGAYHFIQKPFHLDEIRIILKRIEAEIMASAEATMWRSQVDTSRAFGRMLGSTGSMQQIFRMAARASARRNPLLIVGEPGTGKRLIARCIHDSSDRRDMPFVTLDCEEDPAERQLEGLTNVYPAGGLSAAASSGAILLNEVSMLSHEAQSRLFHILDDHTGPPPEVRLVSTTSRDLEPLAARGEFRRDLLYRLSVFVLRMPPLRERAVDIPALVEHFLDLDAVEHGRKIELSSQAAQVLMHYPWPGNVRQLRSVIERSVAGMTGTTLKPGHLPPEIRNWKDEPDSPSGEAEIETMAEVEKRAVMNAMRHTKGDKVKASQLLGISRTTLYRKLEEYK